MRNENTIFTKYIIIYTQYIHILKKCTTIALINNENYRIFVLAPN